MNLDELVKIEIEKAIEVIFPVKVEEKDIQIQPTRKDFRGSHTLVCFPLTRFSKKSPEDTAVLIGDYLVENTGFIKSYNVLKGFLNLEVSDDVWVKQLQNFSTVISENKEGAKEEIMVEYSSPNTNKPLHLGHLRNIFLGWSVSKILAYTGMDVHKVQIINDRGIHICKSMVAWKRYGEGVNPEDSHIKGDKLVGEFYVKFDKVYKEQIAQLIAKGVSKERAEQEAEIMQEAKAMLLKWEAKDPETLELWKTMNSWVYLGFEQTYNRMGVTFDKLYYESETYLLGKDIVMQGLNSGVFYQKEDGSIWVDLSEEGLDHKLLLRSDGTSVYMTQDLGTAVLRFRDFPGITGQVYTVGNEQEYHFRVLFLILKKIGYKWAEHCYHLSYGMVDLPSGKMKSREGTVVDADELMEEVVQKAKEATAELGKIDSMSEEEAEALYELMGLGALKYYLLKVDPKKRMLFNPEESVDLQGNTGPFIQYTHSRISSLLRKAGDDQIPEPAALLAYDLEDVEREIIIKLLEFGKKVEEAKNLYSPSIIAQYVYDLAKEYNKLWQNVMILKESDDNKRGVRLYLSNKVAEVIRVCLDLLGIGAPERM
ncbi:MAG: arginine--tRNA ligase [Cyclobacteriaceae bacterium]|nr:arginine--tRNA ligase [Cyclobacteriaceae bacterium]